MKYMAFTGPEDDDMIFFSDWQSAVQGAKEMGFNFFFPRKSLFSTEKQTEVVMQVDGLWKVVPMSSIEPCGHCEEEK